MLSRPPDIPLSPGVYTFKRRKIPIYIGKAGNLKKRLGSYWLKSASSKTNLLLTEASSVRWEETGSEIEALIKEAELIKKYLPKYNVLLRDDKNYFYVAVTKENFPKIFITHQPDQLKTKNLKLKTIVGPFTSGSALKDTLRLLRKIFPYCTCFKPHRRPCLSSQIGRCLGFCCALTDGSLSSGGSETSRTSHDNNKKQYQENIKKITAVLTGKRRKLLSSLKKQMRTAVKKENYESAAKLRDQVFGLENIFGHKYVLTPRQARGIILPELVEGLIIATNTNWKTIEKELQKILHTDKNISRVEGYDISNISGVDATGSMVVFTKGMANKKEYRHFRIKTVSRISDVDMLKEVLDRRLRRADWPKPDFILIDGGKTQLNAALSVFDRVKIKFPIAALAKREEELFLPKHKYSIPTNSLNASTKLFLQSIRDESHRFARRYHHWLRKKTVKG